MGLKNTVSMLNNIGDHAADIQKKLQKEGRSLVVRNRGSTLFTRVFPHGGAKTYEVKFVDGKFDIHHVL